MIEVHMNEGEYLEYTHTKKSITIDDDISVNLQKREADEDVTIDIYYDRDKNLMLGYDTDSQHIVVQIEIPARQYTLETKDNPNYDPDQEESAMNQKTITTKTAVPFDIEKCTVRLSAI